MTLSGKYLLINIVINTRSLSFILADDHRLVSKLWKNVKKINTLNAYIFRWILDQLWCSMCIDIIFDCRYDVWTTCTGVQNHWLFSPHVHLTNISFNSEFNECWYFLNVFIDTYFRVLWKEPIITTWFITTRADFLFSTLYYFGRASSHREILDVLGLYDPVIFYARHLNVCKFRDKSTIRVVISV